MRLTAQSHLAYCTNIHRGESWSETFQALKTHSLAVKARVCRADERFAIGLRLSAAAARELRADPACFDDFRRWLESEQCYVFTINGFPFGAFHGTRVKEQVYSPDWTRRERLEYTEDLFEILAVLARDAGLSEGSVSTLPGSFKEFVSDAQYETRILSGLLEMSARIGEICVREGLDLHLGLEPEPLGYFETSQETVDFFERLRAASADESALLATVGVNYDTCHLACEYESAGSALQRLREANIRISKLHLSSALKLVPTFAARAALGAYADEVYLHQVIARDPYGNLHRWRDLPEALVANENLPLEDWQWRVHFHIPLHAEPATPFASTSDHLRAVLELWREDESLCHHLEMETYTWDVLPEELRESDVVVQLAAEYQWVKSALSG